MPSLSLAARVALCVASLIVPGVVLIPLPALGGPTSAQTQRTLQALGYDAKTTDGSDAVKRFQVDVCLPASGRIDKPTRSALKRQVSAVQTKMGVPATGTFTRLDDPFVRAFQRREGLPVDGSFDTDDFARLALTRRGPCHNPPPPSTTPPAPKVPEGPPPCAPGTRDLGLGDGYEKGVKTSIRLCAVTGLPGLGGESNPQFYAVYVKGANGDTVVNAQISTQIAALVKAAKADGVVLQTQSAYRSMMNQELLCNLDPGCSNGTNFDMVAKPGTSEHQMGLALDFTTNPAGVTGDGLSCATRQRHPNSPEWVWLNKNARQFGFKQYAKEAWHWDTLASSTRC